MVLFNCFICIFCLIILYVMKNTHIGNKTFCFNIHTYIQNLYTQWNNAIRFKISKRINLSIGYRGACCRLGDLQILCFLPD